MDPTNNNPTINPTSSPEPQQSGADQPAPVAPESASPALNGPTLQPISQEPLTQPSQPQPTAPVVPSPAAPVPPASPASPAPIVGNASQEVSQPLADIGVSAAPGAPVAPNPPIVTPPVNPIINPGVSLPQNGVGATDAILRPEPVAPPDPVEEELKAPMRAAAPVPGSIGSAVSGPAGEADAASNPTPNVSFNDPATEPSMINSSEPSQSKPAKKSNSKTLIALIVIAAIVVIALCGVLAMQFLTPQPTPSSGGSTANSSISEPDKSSSSSGNSNSANTPTASSTSSTLSCTKAVKTEATEENPEGSVSSTVKLNAEFSDGKLTTVSSETVSGVADDDSESVPVKKEIVASDITSTNAAEYNLPVSEDGNVDLTLEGIRKNYELLDFVCEAL